MDALDAIITPSLHKPEKGIIELRLIYVLEDNAIQVVSRLGEPILVLRFDGLPSSARQGLVATTIAMLQEFAVAAVDKGKQAAAVKGATNLRKCFKCLAIIWDKEGKTHGHHPNCSPEAP